MANEFTINHNTYALWKAELASRKGCHQHITIPTKEHWLYFIDGGIMHRFDLPIESPKSADETDWETNYQPTSNMKMDNRSPNGYLQYSPHRDGTKVTFLSIDYTKKCSWWQNATKVLGETATENTATNFTLANDFVIDASCCSERDRIYTDQLLDTNIMHLDGYFKKFYKVYVDGVHTLEGDATNGFTMNFVDGEIDFTNSQTGKTITVDYYYATTSDYKITPKAGKQIVLEKAEAQFSGIVAPKMVFELHMDLGAGDFVASTKTYESMEDFLGESNTGGNKVEQLPFTSLGDLHDVFTLFWDYEAPIALKDSLNMYVIIKPMIASDMPMTGKMATFTFYGLTETE